MEQALYWREIIDMVPDLKPMNVGFFSKIMLMYTQTIFCLFVWDMHLLVAKDYGGNLFADFSEWNAAVVATSDCYNNKTSEPTFMGFSASF